MAASFPSLSNNDIDATFYGVSSLLGGAHCVKHCCAAGFRASDKGGRLTPEEGDNRHAFLKTGVEALFLRKLQIQIDGERLACEGASFANLPAQCLDVGAP